MKVVVTGSSSGIGAAVVNRFLRPDNLTDNLTLEIFGLDKDPPKIFDMRYIHVKSNLIDLIHHPTHFDNIDEILENADILINAAGANYLMPLDDLSVDVSINIMEINAMIPLLLSEMLINLNLYDKFGSETGMRIVNVSSTAADTPMRNSVAYCMSKAALSMQTKCLARELAPRVFVAEVCPGRIDTEGMSESVIKQIAEMTGQRRGDVINDELKRIPMGRYGDAAEVAETIFWLATKAPWYLSGTSIRMAGAV